MYMYIYIYIHSIYFYFSDVFTFFEACFFRSLVATPTARMCGTDRLASSQWADRWARHLCGFAAANLVAVYLVFHHPVHRQYPQKDHGGDGIHKISSPQPSTTIFDDKIILNSNRQ